MGTFVQNNNSNEPVQDNQMKTVAVLQDKSSGFNTDALSNQIQNISSQIETNINESIFE